MVMDSCVVGEFTTGMAFAIDESGEGWTDLGSRHTSER
jgi:hypothetical protein